MMMLYFIAAILSTFKGGLYALAFVVCTMEGWADKRVAAWWGDSSERLVILYSVGQSLYGDDPIIPLWAKEANCDWLSFDEKVMGFINHMRACTR